ncbi:hypothetical protein KAR91_69695 [Candidatus Pacearchaeota archaeon]|nr:hypothetical protein [Candidatus Pacearchaeota archaeon]
MKRLKKFLRKWIGIDELIKAEMTRLASMDNKLLEIRNLFNVGVDFHPQQKYSGSWAVVCIQGKPEYVNFINLNHSNAIDIKHFLRQFCQGRKIVDDPFHLGSFSDGRF